MRRLLPDEPDDYLAELARSLWPVPLTDAEVQSIIHDAIGFKLASEGLESAANIIRSMAGIKRMYNRSAT